MSSSLEKFCNSNVEHSKRRILNKENVKYSEQEEKQMDMIRNAKVKPKIGLLTTGHKLYWSQFPGLYEQGMTMSDAMIQGLSQFGDVVATGLVDTAERSQEAAELFKKSDIDILLIFPLGYCTGMTVAPVAKVIDVPVRIINAHIDMSYDYKSADTKEYLFHEGPCCIPEFSSVFVVMEKKFKVISGCFQQQSFWDEIRVDCLGAATASAFQKLHFGIIGSTYTNMTDMPTDEHRLLRSTGQMIYRPEVEEIEDAYLAVTNTELEQMYAEFREYYDVDNSVTNEHLKESAKIAIAYDKIIRKYDISAFGFYWWGHKEYMTELRAQASLGVSRLASLGRPGVTEGDLKTAMAMKILDLLGGGGMFLEFFAIDYHENFILVGHDGPCNTNVAAGKPKLQLLEVLHGKTGYGLGIDFSMNQGPCTLLNLTQFGIEKTFKLIYTVGEVIPGDILNIGNPNCRIRLSKSIGTFVNDWCQQGPGHHIALGVR